MIRKMRHHIYQVAFQYRRPIKWTLALIVTLTVILLYEFKVFERFEMMTFDYRFVMKAPKYKTQGLVIFVDMDEASIKAIGRWPWPRKFHAGLINALSAYNPKAIAFDVIFAERQDEADDNSLRDAIKNSGRVYLPLSYDLRTQDAGWLTKEGGILSVIDQLPEFGKYLKDTGHINLIPDSDGVMRREPVVIDYKGTRTYLFGMRIGLDVLGAAAEAISFDQARHAVSADIAGGKVIKIPLDSSDQFIINWQKPWGRDSRHYSYIDVINSYDAVKKGGAGVIDLNEFRNKICLVGLTAAGLIDIKTVPIQSAYPAVGITGTIINNVINNDFIYNVPKKVNILLIALVSVLVTLYLSNLRFLGGMLIALISMAGFMLFSVFLFSVFSISISTFYPMLSIFLSYSLTSVYTQIVQSIERRRLFRQATRDGLTLLYNRRHFNLLYEAEFKNLRLDKFSGLALMMADIDDFKKANDTYGHQAGDAILKEVAGVILSKCRQVDVVARYGGEEFIVMLAGAGEKEAQAIAEKIRSGVAEKKFKFGNVVYGTTISIGVAGFSNEKEREELIEKADKALYRAKWSGKNKVCLYSSTATSL
jgi:diguanylate cyclase (GGDEF)-like protein